MPFPEMKESAGTKNKQESEGLFCCARVFSFQAVSFCLKGMPLLSGSLFVCCQKMKLEESVC